LDHNRVILQDLYEENLKKYFEFKNAPNREKIIENIKSDGLTTLEYEVLEEKDLADGVKLVKVRI
jgi:hypothetical protein